MGFDDREFACYSIEMIQKSRTIVSRRLNPPKDSFVQSRAAQVKQAAKSGKYHQFRGALLLALAVLVLWLNSTFLIPLAMGAIFAIVLHPMMKRMDRLPLGEVGKASVITLLFAVSFLLPVGTIVVMGVEAALIKIQSFQVPTGEMGQASVNELLATTGLTTWIEWISRVLPVSQEQIMQWAVRGLLAVGGLAASLLQNLLASLPRATFATLIILITIFFLLLDGKRAVDFIRENSFFGIRQTERIFQTVVALCYSVVVSSLAAGAVQAALIFVSCVITGTEGGVLISLIALILSFLPVIGTAPVTIFLTLQALLAGDFFAATVFLIFIFLVGISDNIVRPYVLKGGAELHPLVGFVAAFGALDAIGFYGVFIGPVVAGLFFAILPMITRSYGSELR